MFQHRHPTNPDGGGGHGSDTDTDQESSPIDPNLRLHTVRTAASSIAEAGRIEDRAQRRKSRRFFRRGASEKRQKHTAEDGVGLGSVQSRKSTRKSSGQGRQSSQTTGEGASKEVPGLRRNVYVNTPLAMDELDPKGEPIVRYVRNKVRTSSESTCQDCMY
jgi:phospholipid-translocating ATPase